MTPPNGKTEAGSGKDIFAWGLLAVAVVFGAYIRFKDLDYASFWRDEASYAFMATASFGELLEILSKDVHAPLLFPLLKGWIGLAGTDEAGFRSFGATLGVLSIPVLFWALRPSLGVWTSAISATLLAVNHAHIYYCQDLTVYPLLTLLAILSVGMMERCLAHGRRGWWAAYGLVLALMAYTHVWGFLFWFAQGVAGVYLLARKDRASEWSSSEAVRFVAVHVAALAAYGPWFIRTLSRTGNRSLDTLFDTPAIFGILDMTMTFWFNSRQVTLAACVMAISLPIAWAAGQRLRGPVKDRQRTALIILGFGAVVPLLVSFETAFFRNNYLERYTVLLIPCFISLVACRIVLMRRRWAAAACLAFVAIWPAVPLEGKPDGRFKREGLTVAKSDRSPMKKLAAYLGGLAKADDLIMIYPEFHATTFAWYYRGEAPFIAYPRTRAVTNIDWPTHADLVEDPETMKTVDAYIRDNVSAGHTFWLVYSPDYVGQFGDIDYGGRLKDLLDTYRQENVFTGMDRQELLGGEEGVILLRMRRNP
jgi:hypothetical protein